jgi:hypothetical protein
LTTAFSILVANEPRAYRDTLGVALKMLRPDVDVQVIDPDSLDECVERHNPAFVVCSHLTASVETRVSAWLLLYPNGEMSALKCIDGERKELGAIDLASIFGLIGESMQSSAS